MLSSANDFKSPLKTSEKKTSFTPFGFTPNKINCQNSSSFKTNGFLTNAVISPEKIIKEEKSIFQRNNSKPLQDYPKKRQSIQVSFYF